MTKKIAILALTFTLAVCSTPLRADDSAAPTCDKRLFKEVKTVSPYSLTHRIKSKKVIYGDIGCGLKWREKQCSSGQGTFDSAAKVYDFNTLAEIEIGKATFVQSTAIPSPMGYGLAAFANPADAAAYLAQKGTGKKLTYQEVLLLDWK